MDFWITLLQQLHRDHPVAPITAAYVIAAIGLNIHFGYTGLMNMGQAGFMLLGAYGFAITVILAAASGSAFSSRSWPASCSRSCSASRPCVCAATTSRSSRSVRPRSCAWSDACPLSPM